MSESQTPSLPRFRRMLSDRDPGVRRVAAWGLAHTGDLKVAPLLIDALVAPGQDEDVVGAARLGLQILSRKVDGLGPPSPSTPDQRAAAARAWHDWYIAIRPLDLDDQDDRPGPSAPAERRPAAVPASPAGSPRP